MEANQRLHDEFKEIVLATRPRVYSFLKRMLQDEETVKDCIQQCYLRLWETFDKVQTREELLPLLFTYSRNIAIDTIRKNSRYIHLESLAERGEELKVTEPLHLMLEAREQISVLKGMVDKLPARQREVFTMIRMEGCSYREVASSMNLTVSTVEKHMIGANKNLGVNKNDEPRIWAFTTN